MVGDVVIAVGVALLALFDCETTLWFFKKNYGENSFNWCLLTLTKRLE